MTQRRHHYESAFEQYLRVGRVPYVAVDEAKKALLPQATDFRVRDESGEGARELALKSFDFVIYGEGLNLLCEVKGRRITLPSRASANSNAGGAGGLLGGAMGGLGGGGGMSARVGRLENWVTNDDVESLACWERLFGAGFAAAFIFVYWCDAQPPDGLFQEIFSHRDRWYAIRACTLADYAAHMRVRSPKWRTLHVSPRTFERISHPFAPPRAGAMSPGAHGGEGSRRSTHVSLDEPIQSMGVTLPAIDRLVSMARGKT
jgi:hypothetical protein